MLKFKTKPKQDPAIEGIAENEKIALLSAYAELVDQCGALQEEAAPIIEQIAALQAKLQPLSEKRAELQKIVDEMGTDDEPLKLNGGFFRAEAGKRGMSRAIKDMALVRKLMGVETFMQVATVKLGDVDKYLTQPQRDQVLNVTRVGRNLKLVRRQP